MTLSVSKSVEESYPELWHYTTATGLQGILLSQQLWATDSSYLNDGEEIVGFFDRKLRSILEKGVQRGINEMAKSADGQSYLSSFDGNDEVLAAHTKRMQEVLRSVTLELQPFVASFCKPTSQNQEDGLLSQWRGYGSDGGYAIVFDTPVLMEFVQDEKNNYFYSFFQWGDVDYFDGGCESYEETLEWEQLIEETAEKAFCASDMTDFEEKVKHFFDPILALASRHKHSGFKEEKEVRIVAFPSPEDMIDEEELSRGDKRVKQVQFRPQNGMLIPYISLFEKPNDSKMKLPIKKIVVGPHHDKLRRQKSIRKLLDQLNIEAQVIVSDIPYIGA